jgi:hypothetical protein
MKNPVDVTFVVPCDEVRQEINGKFIALGIYSERLVVPQFPFQMAMSFFLWVKAKPDREYESEYEVILEPEEKPAARFGFGFKSGENMTERAGIPLPAVPLNIGQAGALVLRDFQTKKELLRLPIIRGETTSSEPLVSQSQPAPQGTS